MRFSVIYVTTQDVEEAKRIGKAIVGEKLAACANSFDGMQSAYWWEGRLEENSEAVLILKTRSSMVDRVVERVKRQHSYTCPCVVSWHIESGNPDYLQWLEDNTRE
jgi:periplasmic divalent cation tolerance protein